MGAKVPVQFPVGFADDAALPIQLGRLYVGHHVVRMVFTPDGRAKLLIPQAAINDGSILVHDLSENTLYGLTEPEKPSGQQ